MTARTVTDIVTHVPVSIAPVEAAFDGLEGLGAAKVSTHGMVMEGLKDEPLGVGRVRHHNAVSFPPQALGKSKVCSLCIISKERICSVSFSKIVNQ